MLIAFVSGLAAAVSGFNSVPNIGNRTPDASHVVAGPAVLPSGSSAAFREQMLDWGAGASADVDPLRMKVRDSRQTPRLDRLRLTSAFGWRVDPITGRARQHAGIDLPS